MAENKKSFIAYADWYPIFKMLSDEEAGILAKTIFSYVNDENPEVNDRVIKMAFETIKLQLKRDLKKYESAKEEKSNGGKMGNLKRWHPDLYDKVLNKDMSLLDAEIIALSRKTSHTDSNPSDTIASVAVNDTDSVTVNDTDNNSKSHCDFSKSQPEGNSKLTKKAQPKQRKKVAPKKESEVEYWKSVVDMWFSFYKSKFVVSPTFKATEGKHLKEIVSRFIKLAKDKDASDVIDHTWTEDRLLRMFEKFLNNAWIDNWLQQHFLLKNLLSNFDSIINIKTNTNGNPKSTSGNKKQFRFNTADAIKTITGNSSGRSSED